MEQALELFELMQARRSADVEKAPTVEALHVEVAPRQAEPLSFMTLQTVEGIVGSMEFCTPQGQTSWESKMEKFLNLGHAYSSGNTVTGERCYMVDEALYRDILLAVAARKQNEQLLAATSERFEQHMAQIDGSNERVFQREKEALEQMAQRINNSYLQTQRDHRARMKDVMADIESLKESMSVPAEHGSNSREMQRLKFEVTQYESVIPIYLARIKDAEDSNQKLLFEQIESTRNNRLLKNRLDRAESLVFKMGTPESIKKRGTYNERGRSPSVSSSTSSGGERAEAGTQQGAELGTGVHVDLSVSPTEPTGNDKGTNLPLPAAQPSFKDALVSSQDQPSPDVIMDGSSGTENTPTLRKLITLSSLSGKKDDAANKRTRSSASHSSDQEQPSLKRPPQNAGSSSRHESSTERRARNLEREEFVQEEVRRSSQDVRWKKGPLPADVDHWFYDFRSIGNEPPASLVAASRNMVKAWKAALGQNYYPLREHSGGTVMMLEQAHNTFKAVTANMPISGWISRACAKHQTTHDLVGIPMLVGTDGDPLIWRSCPLIYYYEQLLEDLLHVVEHNFEPIPRTILNPIPKAQSSSSSQTRNSGPAPISPSKNPSSAPDRYAWRQPRRTRNNKKKPSADDHFQEIAKDIHERNKKISNPYEHEDAEQYNWAFDSLLSDEKKDLVKRSKRLISLIKAGDPPKNYVLRRTTQLNGGTRDRNEGKTIKEYDEFAVFDLEQFIEDISTNNADKHIVGYYEDKIGTCKNINLSDGPSGQGSF